MGIFKRMGRRVASDFKRAAKVEDNSLADYVRRGYQRARNKDDSNTSRENSDTKSKSQAQ